MATTCSALSRRARPGRQDRARLDPRRSRGLITAVPGSALEIRTGETAPPSRPPPGRPGRPDPQLPAARAGGVEDGRSPPPRGASVASVR